MSFQFAHRPIGTGFYEPEAIYLSRPFEGAYRISQDWGVNPHRYGQFRSGGVPLNGHNGIDFELPPRTPVRATAEGRVIEIGNDAGYGRYVRLHHWWGESLYAHLQEHSVEAGQNLRRGDLLGIVGNTGTSDRPHLHFAIRILPYDRADGWGGYTNPVAFLEPL